MKKYLRLLFLCLTGTAALLSAYDLNTRALTPIELMKPPRHENIKLVENGKLKFAIVWDKDAEICPRAKKSIAPAVKLLCEAFEKCTGKQPAVYDIGEAVPASLPCRILVGGSKPAQEAGVDTAALPPQGFEIRTTAQGIIIAGNDSSTNPDFNKDPLDKYGSSKGTLYGAYDFVERFLGVRFYFPGEYGSIWPQIRDFELKPANYRDYPRFDQRGTTYYIWCAVKDEANKAHWEKFMGPLKLKDTSFAERWRIGSYLPKTASHSPTPETLAKNYPDQLKTIFYTSPNGSFFYNPKQHVGNAYNVVDLKFADLLVDAYKRFYESKGKDDRGDLKYWCSNRGMSFGVCDTFIQNADITEDETVKKLNLITQKDIDRDPDAAMANVYGRFYQYLGRRIKEELPGKKLGILAYYNSRLASLDPRWQLPDNIEINLCDFRLPIKVHNPKAMGNVRQTFREWYEALGNRTVDLVWAYNPRLDIIARSVAGEFVGDIPKKLGKYMGRTLIWFDMDGVHDLWNHYYSFYAAHKSQWNPEWDVDAGIDEHWALFYGEKPGAVLKEFHRTVKDMVIKYHSAHDDALPGLYPIAELDKIEKLLAKARSMIKPDSVEMKRFELLSEPWPNMIAGQRARYAYEKPVHAVRRLLDGQQIILDGKDDDQVWRNAACMPMFSPKMGKNLKPSQPVTVKFAWDEKGLYGFIRAEGKARITPDKSIWDNCNFELLLSPGLKQEEYYQIVFDGTGQTCCIYKKLLPIPQPSDKSWMPTGFKMKNSVDDNGWSTEFFLPFSAIKKKTPAPYDCWYANVVHNRKLPKAEYMGSSMTLGVNANLQMFGLIKFGGRGDK